MEVGAAFELSRLCWKQNRGLLRPVLSRYEIQTPPCHDLINVLAEIESITDDPVANAAAAVIFTSRPMTRSDRDVTIDRQFNVGVNRL